MNARSSRGQLTIANIVAACDEYPEFVLDEMQSIIDNPSYDIPDDAPSISNIESLITIQAYYGNQYPYLIGLWGAIRSAATDKNPQRVAMRDYLEKVASACSKKYDAASRVLTGYQESMKEMGARRL